MKTLILNKHFIILSVLLGYLLFSTTPDLNIEQIWVKPNTAENISNPILLGTSVSLVSPKVHAAQRGVVQPIGGHSDPIAHMQGNPASIYTAWLPVSAATVDFDENIMLLHYTATTTDKDEACEGYILIKEINPSVNNMLNMGIYYKTNLVLVEGPVMNCTVIPVSPETSLEELKMLILSNY